MSDSWLTAAPGAVLNAKWLLFRSLERLSDLRGNNTADQLEVAPPQQRSTAIWVFVSTIGELNAIDPLLRELASNLSGHRLVLITDHPHYRAAYEARYPAAVVCVTRGHGRDARTLARLYPPRLLVVAEIPCLPSDAPCRFSVAFVLEAKRARAPAVIVNGWLYHYAPSCRMDGIERRLFEADYLRAFDALCMQTDADAQLLRQRGAPADRLVITGNIKFDAMQRNDWQVSQARSPRLLGALLDDARPVIVAGCVTNLEEQTAVLDAFNSVRSKHPSTLLVLAPRHPEVTERMQALRGLLAERGLQARFRSTMADEPLAASCDSLVLDTMGDLRDFYAAATVAHVGVDHNVLEPLGFDKPVSVMPGWEATYPSYPVYRTLHEERVLLEATNADGLAQHWAAVLDGGERAHARVALSRAVLDRARGAVSRHLEALQPWLERAR